MKGEKSLNVKDKKITLVLDFIMLTAGAVIAAFAMEEFLVPCTILDGGMIGVSIMVNNLSGVSLSILTILFNVPFLIIGSKKMGLKFVVKSIYAMVSKFSGNACSAQARR